MVYMSPRNLQIRDLWIARYFVRESIRGKWLNREADLKPSCEKSTCRSIIPLDVQKEKAQLSRTKSIRSPHKDWRWFQITSWSSFKMNCFRAACASLPTDCKWRMSSSERWVSSDKSWSVISTPFYRCERSSYCRISPEERMMYKIMSMKCDREIIHHRHIWIISLKSILSFSGSDLSSSLSESSPCIVVEISAKCKVYQFRNTE